ncbi:protein FAM200C-like isoform X1 [Myotis yumanensis]|uniref:protein FAM200C-like isoform X1 n=1 Tax=Myotis yumanensis TaxID=159337 RepID=UPI0038D36BA9
MAEFLQDPWVLTTEKLKRELAAHNVPLPAGQPRKDVYVQLYLQHLTARNRPPLAAGADSQGAPDLSGDEERKPSPVLAVPVLAAPVLAAAGRSRRKATKKTDKPRLEDKDDLDVTELTNKALLDQLVKYGVNPGPIVANHPMTMDRVEKNVKKRKYSEDFLQYGFTSIITEGIEKPQCVICCEVLSSESMKPNKLRRHFDSKHPSFAGKDTNYFRSKADGLKKARLDTGGKYQKENVAAVEASYLVALRIARAMKPHTIAKDLLLPEAKDIVRVMIGDEFVTKLSAISLSNDTIRRRIHDMSADILNQVIQEIKSAPLPIFSIQLDESTDVANCSQLLVYVRYINDGDFKDEFLFCKPLKTTATALDVFDTVGSFLKEHKISWEKVCGVCTDGAPATLGCLSGFQRLVLNESPKVIGTHCMTHGQILARKTLPQELQEVMKSVISCVNFVKASTLNSRLFSQLCNELDVPNNALLFHTEARWLSRGKILKRVFELRDELKTFFNQKAKPQFEALFSDKGELQKIAYLVDIFGILHELNLSLQGPNVTCLDLSEKIQSFQMKLQLWQKKLDENKIYMLPTLSAFFEEHDIEPHKRVTMIISVKEHLHMLASEISWYFPNLPDTPICTCQKPIHSQS